MTTCASRRAKQGLGASLRSPYMGERRRPNSLEGRPETSKGEPVVIGA
jgi:hypothetical protein